MNTVKCASCWATISHLETRGERPDPAEGDLTVCPLCGLVSVFTGDGTGTRRPSKDELDESTLAFIAKRDAKRS